MSLYQNQEYDRRLDYPSVVAIDVHRPAAVRTGWHKKEDILLSEGKWLALTVCHPAPA